ncbi:hypothetical protein EA473_03970 [Natrarchaeobius chitinivorans]|uniref:Halobacterial output domain-containing protein n=1 Tax=Natrarchaeobius chitinivorans TaxID=1679083 RepID=A0A3N6MRN6_NATCH|nr:hypothetical protein EA473_03970 [Natrarchaeobius chitinivorans]
MYAVVTAVAEVEDSAVGDLPPLYDAIDPEALNKLFTSRCEPTVDLVEFEYAGYSIAVRGSGDVAVHPA